jgi:hypothetical protein
MKRITGQNVWIISIFFFGFLVMVSTDISAGVNRGFVHGIIVNVDGEDYYLAGAPDGPGGATDIPGHYWVIAGPRQMVARSSDAPDGELLYVVHGIIDMWTEEKAALYASRGYVHYHELERVSDGTLHPNKVLWLKHVARKHFTLDGGPAPQFAHDVSPGVDYEFVPNGSDPYLP